MKTRSLGIRLGFRLLLCCRYPETMGLFIDVGVNYKLLSTAVSTFVARIRLRVGTIVPRVTARVQREIKTRIQQRVRAIACAQKIWCCFPFFLVLSTLSSDIMFKAFSEEEEEEDNYGKV